MQRTSCQHAFLVLFLALCLQACSGKQFDWLSLLQIDQINLTYSKAKKLVQDDQPLAAAELLWETSRQLPTPQQQEMQIYASELLLDHQFPLDAYRHLSQIDEDVIDGDLLLRKRIAEARFYDVSIQYERLIETLPRKLVDAGEKNLRITALQLLVTAHTQSGRMIESIAIELEIGDLAGAAYHTSNTLALWKLATSIAPGTAQHALEKGMDKDLRAWLELALIATPEEVDIAQLDKQFVNWQSTYNQWNLPDSIATEIRQRWEYLNFNPKQVAVLLPLTGTYAKYSKTVREGLHFAHNQVEKAYFKMMFYNTDDENRDILQIYQQAVVDGADLVLGPLLKDNIAILQSTQTLTVPVLTFNYATNPSPNRHQELFQFGLLPEDEAIQTAERLIKDENYFSIVFQPNSEWGNRLTEAFTSKYTELGGVIRKVVRYDKQVVDFSALIEDNFGLANSYARHRTVANTIGYVPEFTPYVRSDTQAVVLFADEKYARLIYPQMKYHYLDQFPVYATSHVYNPGETVHHRDLNGLIYCEAPIVFSEQLQDLISKNLDLSQLRLFALGVDAYHLTQEFRRMYITRSSYPGMTGLLSIQNNKHLFRKLPWARFVKDKPQLLH